MNNIILKSTTGLFIGRTPLECVSVESITWRDERVAFVQIDAPYSQKEYIDLVDHGVTIDLMCGCGYHDRQNRDAHRLILSMVDIFDVETTMWEPVINSPDRESRVTLSKEFCCSLEFAKDA